MESNTFNELYGTYADMVYNLSLNYLQSSEEAEEVTQDVFLKVYDKLASFNGKSSHKTWIYRITINLCLDRIKSNKRQKRFRIHLPLLFTKQDGKESPHEVPDFNHPGVQLEDKEAMAQLFAKINSLPEKQKTALILKSIDGESIDAIAEIMKTTPKAVESLLSRAKAGLRSMKNGKD